MKTTRRSFIQTLGSAFALTFAGGAFASNVTGQTKPDGDLFEIPAEAYTNPLSSMTAKQFDSYIGHSFTAVSQQGQTIHLVLTEVNLLERQPNTLRGYYGDSYSLIFEGPDRVLLTQGTYEMNTDGLSSFSALLVPTGRRQRQYELIVNRITR